MARCSTCGKKHPLAYTIRKSTSDVVVTRPQQTIRQRPVRGVVKAPKNEEENSK